MLDNNDIKPVDGSGRAPCAVLAVDIHLHDNEIRELVFGLGMATDHQSAIYLADSCRSNRNFHHNLERVSAKWHKRLGQITISSQDKQLDLMFNGWLLYQVISCRLLSRAAFYFLVHAVRLNAGLTVSVSHGRLSAVGLIDHVCRQHLNQQIVIWLRIKQARFCC